jgi:hypothetical protein
MIRRRRARHRSEGEADMFDTGTMWVVLFVAGILIVAYKTLVIVPQGFEYTRERLV